jgi:molybdenum cofactor biosynthesis protein B
VGHGESDHHRADLTSVPLALLTVSDSRSAAEDRSGALLRRLSEDAGHRVLDQRIVSDDEEAIREAVLEMAGLAGCRAVLVTGGTGLAARDVTCEVISGLLEKRLDGFGELFRSLSFSRIGPHAMLSRALAGSRGGVFLAALPGSSAAVSLAMEELILPVLGHVAGLLDPPVDRAGGAR